LVCPSYTWIHGQTVAEDAREELDLDHEPGGPSTRPGPLRTRPHVVAAADALELEQPVPRACAGVAVQVVRRRAPVEACWEEAEAGGYEVARRGGMERGTGTEEICTVESSSRWWPVG
jgi:hypothetical protein